MCIEKNTDINRIEFVDEIIGLFSDFCHDKDLLVFEDPEEELIQRTLRRSAMRYVSDENYEILENAVTELLSLYPVDKQIQENQTKELICYIIDEFRHLAIHSGYIYDKEAKTHKKAPWEIETYMYDYRSYLFDKIAGIFEAHGFLEESDRAELNLWFTEYQKCFAATEVDVKGLDELGDDL